MQNGQKRTEITGPLRRYLDRLHKVSKYSDDPVDMVVYGHHVFLVANGSIVTTWPLPTRFRKGSKRKFYETEEAA